MQYRRIVISLLFSTLLFSQSLFAALIINEVDYDQPGTDNAEFIELFNSSDLAIDLSLYRLDLINGYNSSVYQSFSFSSLLDANDYYVICSDGSLVANCDLDASRDTNLIQNGSPDAIALYFNDVLVDSLSYEGSTLNFSDGHLSTVSDSNDVELVGLSLVNDEFTLSCITPGEMNTLQRDQCSSVNVPEPMPLSLLLCGLLGLVRTKKRRYL